MNQAPDRPAPLLVYNRISTNRQKTRVLLAAFTAALVPVILCGAAVKVPWKAIYHAGMQSYVQALHAQYVAQHVAQADWVLERWRTLLERPAALFPFDVATLVLWMAIVTVALGGATAFLISRYGSRVVLRVAGARPVKPDEDRELLQTVQTLCLGAGLPVPRVHVIESAAPNAFATGTDPHDACLVVTRGLLLLLDRRELEGVIAHELSHIGNHDIGLNTALAALVGALSLPSKLVAPLFCSPHVAVAVTMFGVVMFYLAFPLLCTRPCPTEERYALGSPAFWQGVPTYVIWWGVYALIVPVYVVFIAPVVGLLIRQAVSRQREFLADADAALLTRDPEGLALALLKISAVGGERLRVGEGTAHLYFVDPLSEESWVHVLFPSHPPLEQRVDLLARMGNGIAPSAIQAAEDAGFRFRVTKADRDEVHAPVRGASGEAAGSRPQATAATEPPTTVDTHNTSTGFDGFTRIYELPVEGSRLLALLPAEGVLELKGRVGDFVAVTTEDGMEGYVFRPARLRERTAS